MMPHIRLEKFLDEVRHARGGSRELPQRDQSQHGTALMQQLQHAVQGAAGQRTDRSQDLPSLPEEIQVLLQGATTSTGKVLLDHDHVPKGWNLEIIEERQDGLLVALSRDPGAQRLMRALDWYQSDARTPSGRRKAGVKPVFTLEEVPPPSRSFRMGDELAITEIEPDEKYLVDIEIAAGYEKEDNQARITEFREYLAEGEASVMGTGPLVGPDYALFRAWVPGSLLEDLLDVHPWVTFVDLPPVLEREGLELLNIQEPDLPEFIPAAPDSPVVAVIDGGVIPQQPLIAMALRDQQHVSYLPTNTSVVDGGTEGHGTAVASIAALGNLRQALLNQEGQVQPVRVAMARVLGDDTRVPDDLNLLAALPHVASDMLARNGARVLNHSVASRAPFRRTRMSVWAETIDRICYDEGGDGFLVVMPTGNIDGEITPTLARVEQWLRNPGYPSYLADERCRLRNPAQAINALTVGAYVPGAVLPFHQQQVLAHQLIAGSNLPSPFTRRGFGYLGDVKPEVVEEGGNWCVDGSGRLIRTVRHTDVAVANSTYATTGRLIRFTAGTSFAAPKVAHLAALIQAELPDACVDLIRALIVNSAMWPSRLDSVPATLQVFGYGVPSAERALEAGGSRCLIRIEDAVQIGHVHYFRLPFPHDLFEANPELMLRVSVTLAYRAPVRKTNLKYRGTVLEWDMAKRGERLDQFRVRTATRARPPADEDEDGIAEEPIGGWNWNVGIRRRTHGTAQKDWFEAPSHQFDDEVLLAVVGRRGWLSSQQQEEGFHQRYAMAISIEVVGAAIPIHESIEARVRVPVESRVTVPVASL